MSQACRWIRYLSFWLLATSLTACSARTPGDVAAFTPSPAGSTLEMPTAAPTLTPTEQTPIPPATQALTATVTLTPTLTASLTLNPAIPLELLTTETWTPAPTAREPKSREQERKFDWGSSGG